MFDGGKIVIGLFIIIAIITLPFYYNLGDTKEAPIQNEKVHPFGEFFGYEGKSYTNVLHRANHMKLLDIWRDRFVRENDRGFHEDVYGIAKGYNPVFAKGYTLSLQKTCMQCHARNTVNSGPKVAKATCNECHNYSGVDPYCWDCHFIKEDTEKWQKK